MGVALFDRGRSGHQKARIREGQRTGKRGLGRDRRLEDVYRCGTGISGSRLDRELEGVYRCRREDGRAWVAGERGLRISGSRRDRGLEQRWASLTKIENRYRYLPQPELPQSAIATPQLFYKS